MTPNKTKPTMESFIQTLQTTTKDSYLDAMAKCIFYVEYKMSKDIRPEYPFLKFWQQWEFLREHHEEQAAEMINK